METLGRKRRFSFTYIFPDRLCLLLINCGNFTVAILPWLLLPDLIILHLSVRTYSWSRGAPFRTNHYLSQWAWGDDHHVQR